jgi:acetylornithine aminotransferase/acetylornithine/N-succinyldiaminopimelate aminotransferase
MKTLASKKRTDSAAGKAKKPPTRASKTNSILRDADQFLLPTYKRQPIVFTHGRGCYIYDSHGKKYLDFLGGIAVNALGHAHPRIVKVIRREAGRAIHLSNLFHHQFQGPLARKLAQWSGLDRVFFANSGAEAVEGALKLARLYGRASGDAPGAPAPKHRILALENSFHGRTFGAVSVTATEKYRLPFAPLVPGVEFVRFNDLGDLESKFDGTVCAILLETIQGEGGVFPVSEEFWERARSLASRNGALLIADEIQCGLGRSGRYFAYQKFSSRPDVVLVAKPLAAGLPLGAVITTEAVAQRISPGLHGTTFGGGPLACATSLEFLNIIEDENLLENIRARGAELREGLSALAAKFPFIREIRGEGLMIGVQLSVDGAPYVAEAMRRSLLINCTHDSTLRFLPPFLVTRVQVRQFLRLLEKIFVTTPRKATAPEPANSAPPSHAALAAAR